jgi:hypothetical protein
MEQSHYWALVLSLVLRLDSHRGEHAPEDAFAHVSGDN